MLRKILYTVVLLLVSIGSLSAQDKSLERANAKYDEFSFTPAIDIYKKVLDKGFVSAELLKKLGNSYYFNAEYKDASEIYGRLVTEYPTEVTPDYYFRYAQTLRSLGEYEAADDLMKKFSDMTSGDYRANNFTTERDYRKEIKENSGRYSIGPFESNTVYSEFAPSYYKEGLLFSSDRDTGNLAKYRHTWNSKDFLDIYKINVDSVSMSKVVKMDKAINTRFHESTTVATKDGKTIYFTRNNFKEGKSVKDDNGVIRLKIFRAVMEDSIFAYIEELPFNSDSYSVAHPALSPDEKTLYFASDMPGTLGESDIFKVTINDDETFGTPENLGNTINTEARETFPFVTSEEILYFSSEGHPGLGGLDVFATKIKDNNYTGIVKNVGEPINGKLDDFTFIFDEDTKTGYFASNRESGLGNDDIYSFVENIPLELDCKQPVSGVVRDKISNQVLVGATVKVINEDNVEILQILTDANGYYEILIDCDQGNFIRAMTDGYIPSEEYMGESDGKPQVIDFYLERDKIGAGFGDDLAKLLQLSTIYFDLNKYNIRPDAEVEIQKVIAAMEKYPSLKIKVNSHTDSRGKDAYNLWLSQKRAESTVGYMVSKGISADRLEGEGFGETKLVNGCGNNSKCSSKEHDLNRRSEFIIRE
ncbi:OmpA family protein [Cellulophaga sp. E16_2]|uniref:OmpA/MotB domain protein n=1 Tax=Cellulophaga algicola (strain DSM 14237 / IC166 / ACAM 630) TaxID=688270 RepID=E6X848_CELAD|nr:MULTISPECIES: OmpA family protein [Cellulophaga]ADV49674.1 OmpA/MotB domain protein [Cellulophaga algicola DSM 14237]MBO0592128.1 OmpA family protein [Cellulophaga sp. E16_2]